MSQQFLHGADVVTVLQQMRGERMSQRVAAHVLGNAGGAGGFLDPADEVVLVDVVPPDHAGARIDRAFVGWKNKFPCPLVRGARVLARKSVRQFDIAIPRVQVLLVQYLYPGQMRLQWFDYRFGQNCDTVFSALCCRQTYVVATKYKGYAAPKGGNITFARPISS